MSASGVTSMRFFGTRLPPASSSFSPDSFCATVLQLTWSASCPAP